MDPSLDGPSLPSLNGMSMIEPGRQERLPRPGQRGGVDAPSVSRTTDQPPRFGGTQAPAPPRVNVQEEPRVEISLDGDGALLAAYPPAARPSGRLQRLLDSGRQMLSSSSAYSAVGAADDLEPASRRPAGAARAGRHALDWPEPEDEGSASHCTFLSLTACPRSSAPSERWEAASCQASTP